MVFRRSVAHALACLFLAFVSATTVSAQSAPSVQQWHSLLDKGDYFSLRETLAQSKANTPARVFFDGVVASKFNRLDEAERLLESALKQPLSGRDRRKTRDYLVEVYTRKGEYRKAADLLATILKDKTLSREDRSEYETSESMLRALSEVKPPVRDPASASDLVVSWSPKDTIANGLSINGVPIEFGFDTGANFSICSESAARQLKLRPVESTVSVGTINTNRLDANFHVADTLKIGDAIAQNVVFLVIPDESMRISGLDGVVGMPVTWVFDRLILNFAGEKASAPASGTASEVAYEGLNLLATARFRRTRLVFTLDTGASKTDLYPNFLKLASRVRARLGPATTKKSTGLGGSVSIDVRALRQEDLEFAGRTVRLREAPIWLKASTDGSKKWAGNLGHDVFQQFRTLTIDFRNMTLTGE